MKDFLEILTELQKTPVPLILIGGGILFLFIAVGGQIGGKISTDTARVKQGHAAILGGILLLLGAVLYIVPIIVSPSFTPTAIVEVTPEVSTIETNTPTGTVEKATSEDGMNLTPTPHPPMDTPTPAPPSTPTPTNTSRPTPTPTATIDADPTVYDNFNNPANDGSFNKYQWKMFNDSMGKAIQKDGKLIVSHDGKTQENGVGLYALKYDNAIQTPTFFEVKFMLDKPPQNGRVYLFVWTDISTGDYSDCDLGYGDNQAWIGCGYVYQGDSSFRPNHKPVNYGIWHTVRIEIEPTTMTFTYYINGEVFGSYISPNAEALKKAKFGLQIGVYATSSEPVIGYLDDVRIGQVGQ